MKKKNRKLKVYEASGYQNKDIPTIILKGEWLKECGFCIGENVEVECQDDILVIRKIE